MSTVRLVNLIIHVGAVIDDGETLRPIQVEPIQLAAVDWQQFDPERLAKELTAQIPEDDSAV